MSARLRAQLNAFWFRPGILPLSVSVMAFFYRLRRWISAGLVVLYCDNPIFIRKVEAYAEMLRIRGFRVQIIARYAVAARALIRAGDGLWIIFGGRVMAPSAMPARYLFYVADPIDRPREHNWVNAEYFQVLGQALGVWGYTRACADPVARLGLPFHHVPFGYAPHYEAEFRRSTAGKNIVQDIDVLFFGNLSERRRDVLEKIRQLGMAVRVIDRSCPVYGTDLDLLLARTRIVLSLNFYGLEEKDLHIPDFARLDHLLANRIFVLHESCSGAAADPEFAGHVATCAYEAIPDTCLHYLAHPDERAASALRASEWFKSRYHLDQWIPYPALSKLL